MIALPDTAFINSDNWSHPRKRIEKKRVPPRENAPPVFIDCPWKSEPTIRALERMMKNLV
jgi:hypothetical protein